jgi:hypothetical protein
MSTIEIPKYTILTKRKDTIDSLASSLQSPEQESTEIDTVDVSDSIATTRPRRNIKKPVRYEPQEVCLDDKDPAGEYDDTDTEDTVSSGVEWESEDETESDFDEDDSFIAGSEEDEEYESE